MPLSCHLSSFLQFLLETATRCHRHSSTSRKGWSRDVALLALLALLAPPQKLPDLSTLWVLCAAACARGRYPLTQTTSQAGNKWTSSKKVDKQNLQLTSLRRTWTSTENKSVWRTWKCPWTKWSYWMKYVAMRAFIFPLAPSAAFLWTLLRLWPGVKDWKSEWYPNGPKKFPFSSHLRP